ncbi:MAG: RNA polymerase sigma factor [Bacteroidetes bacterium]|nr:MAG: RNA polymerase sigma factor [Bacteroidota bacterium]MBL1143693.1 RNA polymerase sigma factor [Bacteroidota bacterium]NOG56495.1 RNA polymerase sigma factor [Bacteroidota bacterium]
MTVKEYNNAVELHSDHVFRFILKSIRDQEKAKDIVQDAFEKLWHKVEEVDALKCKAYLFTTAYRRMIDIIRREKKQGNWNEVSEKSYSHSGHYSDLSEILQSALAQLTEVQRSVIMLRDYEGYDYNEISEITNLSLSQVKVYIFRARKYLKDYLVSIETVV